MPVETTSEQAIMPVTITIVEVLPPPPPELISYEYTKNDTGYMYRWVSKMHHEYYQQFESNFRFNFHLNKMILKFKHVAIDVAIHDYRLV